jgi:parvulin-like peptidyl-prolyl isomerase
VGERVEQRIQEEAREVGGADPMENLRSIYRREGLSLEDVRRDYARLVKPQILIEKVVKKLRVVDDKALREYYEQTYAGTRYHVRHIMYRYRLPGLTEELVERKKQEALTKALKAVERIRNGADFEKIARAESEDEATWRRGGDMGYVTRDAPLHPTIRDAIFNLKPGETSSPVEYSDFGSIHVFQVPEILPRRSFEECQAVLRKEFASRKPALKEIEDVLQKLRDRADIKVFGHPVKGIFPERSAERGTS